MTALPGGGVAANAGGPQRAAPSGFCGEDQGADALGFLHTVTPTDTGVLPVGEWLDSAPSLLPAEKANERALLELHRSGHVEVTKPRGGRWVLRHRSIKLLRSMRASSQQA